VSDIVHNGSNQGVRTAQVHPHHEFLELCALSTTGELTVEERMRLEKHLSHCRDCGEIKQQYEYVVATTIPTLASDLAVEDDEDSSMSWSIEQAEETLMKSLSEEPSPLDHRPISPPAPAGWKRAYYATAAALLLSILAVASYRAGVHRGRRMDSVTMPPATPASSTSPNIGHAGIETVQAPPKAEPEDGRMHELRNQTRLNLLEITRLKESQSQLDDELSERTADLDRSLQDRSALDKQLASAQSNAQSLQEELALVRNQKSLNSAQSASLETRVKDLNTALEAKDQQIAQERELLQHDRDIRNLIGARDLYIAEIYDVAKTGDTQKPFGRVFYTKDKSLIFYGYDLDQQQGIKNVSTFQAWGRRGADQEHDVSLGLLYQDDANMKRWVLKLNDAPTLAQIDAVFVTVEPKGGSAKPSGKPLLFTYLRINPNHP
jgi:uncharacterized membrane protein